MSYRATTLRHLAAQQGYLYSPTDEGNLFRQIEEFRLPSRGRARQITNVLRRQHSLLEYDAYLFDYSFQDYAGKHVHRQSVLYLHSQQLGLPELMLQPETLLHKLGELFGLHDIDFVRFPKFSKQYRLTGEDEDYIRHHFSEDVLNYFTLNKGWSVEALGYYLLLYKQDVLLSPDQLEALFQRGLEVYRLFRMPAG